ncbi:MAG: SGNH/GDSL hydrolase family protein [Anaerolineales bacterium]|nr:SGNH/GDSL hydrolase family protein [Anaerolineales bacterium]
MDLLIVGNSVSLKSDVDSLTYPNLLIERLAGAVNVFQVIRAGSTVCDLEADVILALEKFSPKLMILQIGHVDCAPRPLKKRERNKLSALRPNWLKNQIIRFIHNYRPHLIRVRGLIQFAPLNLFKESVNLIVKKAALQNCFTFILPITHVSALQEKREPWYNQEIERYNSILRTLSSDCIKFIEQEDLLGQLTPDEYCLTPEDLHLKSFAHERITHYLEIEIRKRLNGLDAVSQH